MNEYITIKCKKCKKEVQTWKFSDPLDICAQCQLLDKGLLRTFDGKMVPRKSNEAEKTHD